MCGVFGIRSDERDVSRLAYFGLFALQHRGQESAGIAVAENGRLTAVRELGPVSQVFDEQTLRGLRGEIAIGHTRYSTTGSTHWVNAQPIVVHGLSRTVALGHNGNLTNAEEIRAELAEIGVTLRSTSDTEVIAALIANDEAPLAQAVANAMAKLEGAFTVTAIADGKLVAFRDRHGFRPLTLGSIDGDPVVASESCALDLVGAEVVREIAPGELVVIDEEGVHAQQAVPQEGPGKFCIFEFFYLRAARLDDRRRRDPRRARTHGRAARPRSSGRGRPGSWPIPDSGTPAAIGYSRESGIPFHEGLIKNRYVGRTFIQPEQGMREQGISRQVQPADGTSPASASSSSTTPSSAGTPCASSSPMLHDAGATEVHVRISSPPIVSPGLDGIDFGTADQLIASDSSVEEVRGRDRRHLSRATSSLEGLQENRRRAGEAPLPRLPHARVSDAHPRGTNAGKDEVRAQPRLERLGPTPATARGPSPPWRFRG